MEQAQRSFSLSFLRYEAAFGDFLLNSSKPGRLTIGASEQFIDGIKLNMLMNKDEFSGLKKQLFDADEVAHLNRIRATALRLTRRQFQDMANL